MHACKSSRPLQLSVHHYGQLSVHQSQFLLPEFVPHRPAIFRPGWTSSIHYQRPQARRRSRLRPERQFDSPTDTHATRRPTAAKMSMFRAKKFDLGCFTNIKIIRDHSKRKAFEAAEAERY